MNDRDRRVRARVALTWLAEPGNRTVHTLVTDHGPVAALDLLLAGDVPDDRLRAAVTVRCAEADPRRVADLLLRRTHRVGARIVTPDDDDWPRQLDDLVRLDSLADGDRWERNARPPLCLWLRGAAPTQRALGHAVAVVGARAATSYGVHVATELAHELADRGWTVVSGGAYGIDAAAHRGALAAGAATVAVLASGVDRPYPAGNTALFDRIADAGLLVSEWPPGSEPHRHRFLVRNRVIAAATAGTVMVEAAARSGATSTLRRALGLGRPAMVVPGPVTSAMSVGCHAVLREYPRARLVAGVAHVLEEVGRIGADLAPPERGPAHARDGLDPGTALLLDAMPARRPISAQELAARAGQELRDVLRRLALLVELGLLRGAHGRYTLTPAARAAPRSAARPAPGAPS